MSQRRRPQRFGHLRREITHLAQQCEVHDIDSGRGGAHRRVGHEERQAHTRFDQLVGEVREAFGDAPHFPIRDVGVHQRRSQRTLYPARQALDPRPHRLGFVRGEATQSFGLRGFNAIRRDEHGGRDPGVEAVRELSPGLAQDVQVAWDAGGVGHGRGCRQ